LALVVESSGVRPALSAQRIKKNAFGSFSERLSGAVNFANRKTAEIGATDDKGTAVKSACEQLGEAVAQLRVALTRS
jgi:hypothetical protein